MHDQTVALKTGCVFKNVHYFGPPLGLYSIGADKRAPLVVVNAKMFQK